MDTIDGVALLQRDGDRENAIGRWRAEFGIQILKSNLIISNQAVGAVVQVVVDDHDVGHAP